MSVPQIVMEGDTARARLTDPLESHMAADGTAHQVWRSQQVVEQVLAESYAPLDDLEILPLAKAIEPFSAARFRSARAELVERGVIVSAGRHKAPNADGNLTTRGLWKLKNFDDHFDDCEVCGVRHWFRFVREDRMRYEIEFMGYCGNERNLQTAEE